ncbi:uncharacterized protein QYS62_011115 [Fusarium acuminatum]|uniref:BZIP domain-containing protein n=1 Tax=Fusarium acuminatum TaxID=5515 RepID=A0ABZ2X9W0_9HYPO
MRATHQETSAQDRKDRKRLQNRLNQRARRQRIKAGEEKSFGLGKRPYRIDRWRLGANVATSAATKSSQSCTELFVDDQDNPDSPSDESLDSQDATCTASLSISVDHSLIHLICYNVCRGFGANKMMMGLFANFIMAVDFPVLRIGTLTSCEIGVVRPLEQHFTLPHSLKPTQLQMNSPHPSWMDVLPFPDLRDNLIRKQLTFNHVELLEDLVGDYVHVMPPAIPQASVLSSTQGENQYHAREEIGLILWGEPHLKESWEMTFNFWRKWSHVTGECKELVRCSNSWRLSRGEHPLPIVE